MPSRSRTLTCAKAKLRKTGSETLMARMRIQARERSSLSPEAAQYRLAARIRKLMMSQRTRAGTGCRKVSGTKIKAKGGG